MNLTKISHECHETSKKKGFYDMLYKLTESDSQPKEEVEEILSSHICMKILLVITELSEAVEALRNNGLKELTIPVPDKWNEEWKGSFKEEIADTFIRLFDLCGFLDIDIQKAIDIKQEKNKSRPYKHGRSF